MVFRFGITVLILIATGCSSAPDSVPAIETAVQQQGKSYDTSQIVLVSEATEVIGPNTFTIRHYRNMAYRCGRNGYYAFLVAHRPDLENQLADLWVFLYGGGVGAYDAFGVYQPDSLEALNDEPTYYQLLGRLPNGTDETLQRRYDDGHRFLILSMCDHDLYSGDGQAYPNNPHWSGTDTVDGLAGSMAAVDFTRNGNETYAGYQTGRIFSHGVSAGAVGAYTIAYRFAQRGLLFSGALLDSFIVSKNTASTFGFGCNPLEADPDFSWPDVQSKVGQMISDPNSFVDAQVAAGLRVPIMDVIATGDGYCCGGAPIHPQAALEGFSNNCVWVHQPLWQAMIFSPISNKHRRYSVSEVTHVLTRFVGPVNDAVDEWIERIKTPPDHTGTFVGRVKQVKVKTAVWK